MRKGTVRGRQSYVRVPEKVLGGKWVEDDGGEGLGREGEAGDEKRERVMEAMIKY